MLPKKVRKEKKKTEVPEKIKYPGRKWKEAHGHLFHAIHRDYSIGQMILPKRDLGRMVKWPTYIKIQRQRKILLNRLKVPPQIHQFSKTLEKNGAQTLFSLLHKYRPESDGEKKKRLKLKAEQQLKGKETKDKPRKQIQRGINHVTSLVERKEARLVVIAHDVNPLELVIWLPALCKKMGVPYCIVKGKSRLGRVVHMKTCCALAITTVEREDEHRLEQMIQSYIALFNDQYEAQRKKWGGGILGFKANAVLRKKEKSKAAEMKKMGHLLS